MLFDEVCRNCKYSTCQGVEDFKRAEGWTLKCSNIGDYVEDSTWEDNMVFANEFFVKESFGCNEFVLKDSLAVLR